MEDYSPSRKEDNPDSKQRKLLDAARALIEHVSPDYAGQHKDYAISFSEMEPGDKTQYVRTHVDSEDIASQFALTLGKFDGGHLTTWSMDGTTVTTNYYCHMFEMDGRLPHRVSPIEKLEENGKRFCVIFYKLLSSTK